MTNHNFAFIVSGVDPHADDFADRFYEAGCSDATLMLIQGLVAVCFAREAEDFAHAVISAYSDVVKTGASVERFEPDFLVSKAEIAKRAELTPAAVSNYVAGARGQYFPAPKARITSASPLWDWVEVSSWLHQNGALPVETVVQARISRAINVAVQYGELVKKASDKQLIALMKSAARAPVFA